jgi:hypothetical protein
MSFTSDSIEEMTAFALKLNSDTAYYKQLSSNASTTALRFTHKNADLLVQNHINNAVPERSTS